MNSIPEQDPVNQEPSPERAPDALPRRAPSPEEDRASAPEHRESAPQRPIQDGGTVIEPMLFRAFMEPERLSAPRIPNFGDLCLLGALTFVGVLAAGFFTRSALDFHLFGASSLTQATTDIDYTLGSMMILYVVTFGAAFFVFPFLWHRSFFDGVQWRIHAVRHIYRRLLCAALLCCILAVLNSVLMPGPNDAPIDRIFRSSGAAWLMFVFGVTAAPFFEELTFRGFLLPALCTAWDWTAERLTGSYSTGLDENGHPQWSMMAMVFGALLTSIPFALMHAEQTAWAAGPLLLLMLVSLVLCWMRLATRSLAASVLVHASYNFLLFSMMLVGTGGFRHLGRL